MREKYLLHQFACEGHGVWSWHILCRGPAALISYIVRALAIRNLYMFNILNRQSLHLLLIFAGLLFTACSVERKNPLSKAYHNTTAHYNGYFLAKEKMAAIEKGLQEQMVYDYNQLLPLYPNIDSTTFKAFEADLEDVVKKASFPIQYHKNSKWIDDSYVLIGKVRYYQLNFTDAAQTFRYVNSSSADRHTRHEALVWLMRTFMQEKEWDNALAVSEVLRKERLNKENARELYLARAHYHLQQGDTAAMVENLALSIPNFEKRDEQSRVRFSLARLYQSTTEDKKAYAQYNKILRRNPPFDLGFFSRLYLGQVTELSNSQGKDRIAKYYKKMLKDSKNAEYRDKIYYEMALFELRQQNYDKALALLQQSLKENGTLANQKSYSYLLAGEIYFENLSKYNLAQAYYDSAVQVYPQLAPGYEQVLQRKNVLTDFVTQYNTIQTQDSLQRLARLSEEERSSYLRQLVQKEEEQRLQAIALQQERLQKSQQRNNRTVTSNQNNTGFATASTSAGGVWYFDNPAAMATARSEFARKWGDRPLQDSWRLQTRGEMGTEVQVAQQETASPAAESAQDVETRLESQVQAYLENIPLTTAAMQKSEKQVEEALFELGKIYSQKLNDSPHAIEAYEQLLQRFAASEHAPEVNYSLYLLYDKAGDERKSLYYKNLKQQYAGTIYAKLVDDPTFMSKNAEDNVRARALYDAAYSGYEQQRYKEASALLAQLESRYPHNDISDKVAFLGVMVTARTEKPQALRDHLNRFKASHPTSPLREKANQLLAMYADLEQKNLLRQEAPSITPVVNKGAEAEAEKARASLSTAIASTDNRLALPLARQEQYQKIKEEVDLPSAPTAEPKQEQPEPKQEVQAEPLQEKPEPKQPAISQEEKVAVQEEQQPEQPPVLAQETVTPPAQADALLQPMDSVFINARMLPDTLEYSAEPDSVYYFVIAHPAAAPAFKDIRDKYERYNSTYYKDQKMSIEALAFSGGRMMMVMRSFNSLKVAQDYNIKQKGPMSPVGRIRGVDFTTFVISASNYRLFLRKQDLEAYLTFFRNNY